MPQPMSYIPRVTCAKCNAPIEFGKGLVRLYNARSNQRYLEARCHGQVSRLPFASQPDRTIQAFGSQTEPNAWIEVPA